MQECIFGRKVVRVIALQGKMIPCNSREVVITVRSYDDGVMIGYLQHPRLRKKEELHSLSQMLLLINSLLDLEDSLYQPLPLIPVDTREAESIAVFRIQILFREHYTWQGRLIWQNENAEAVFRSGIELIQMLDEILSGTTGA